MPDGARWKQLRVATIYLPNGNPVETEKYPYKLAWMERLRRHAAELLTREEPIVLGGDYNVIPTDNDVYDPVGWADDALARPQTRAKFREILNLGYTDAFKRAASRRASLYLLGLPGRRAGSATTACASITCCCRRRPPIASKPARSTASRARKEKPSDHTPIWCELRL